MITEEQQETLRQLALQIVVGLDGAGVPCSLVGKTGFLRSKLTVCIIHIVHEGLLEW